MPLAVPVEMKQALLAAIEEKPGQSFVSLRHEVIMRCPSLSFYTFQINYALSELEAEKLIARRDVGHDGYFSMND